MMTMHTQTVWTPPWYASMHGFLCAHVVSVSKVCRKYDDDVSTISQNPAHASIGSRFWFGFVVGRPLFKAWNRSWIAPSTFLTHFLFFLSFVNLTSLNVELEKKRKSWRWRHETSLTVSYGLGAQAPIQQSPPATTPSQAQTGFYLMLAFTNHFQLGLYTTITKQCWSVYLFVGSY